MILEFVYELSCVQTAVDLDSQIKLTFVILVVDPVSSLTPQLHLIGSASDILR